MLWDAEVRLAAARWGRYYGIPVDPALVHGVIESESAHGRAPNYINNGGVVPEPGGHRSGGPMQVYDTTLPSLGFPGVTLQDLARYPAIGIDAGTKYLAGLLKRFQGDTARAVAAYNAGPGNAQRNAAGKFSNQAYVDRVLGFWKQYRGAVVTLLPVLVMAGVVLYLNRRRRAA